MAAARARAGGHCRQWRPAARWLVPFVGSSQRAPWVVVPFVDGVIHCGYWLLESGALPPPLSEPEPLWL